MIMLCKSVLSRKAGENVDEQLKSFVDSTAKNLQTPLNHFIRTIQNAKSGGPNGKKKGEDEKKPVKGKGGKDNGTAMSSARVFFF